MASLFKSPTDLYGNKNTNKNSVGSSGSNKNAAFIKTSSPNLYNLNKNSSTIATSKPKLSLPLALQTNGTGKSPELFTNTYSPTPSAKNMTPSSANSSNSSTKCKSRPVPPPINLNFASTAPMTGKDSKQQKKVQPPPLIINDSHKADIGNITNTITTTTSSTANVDVANDSNIDTRNSGGSSVLEDFENKLTLNEKKMLSSSSSSSSLSTLTSKTTTANGSNTNTNLGTGSINTSHVTDIDTLTEKEWHNATYMKSQILTLSLLGEGAGGSVTKCKLKNGNKVFALKTISNNTKNNRGKNSGNSYGTSTETNVGNSRLQNNSKDIEDDLDVETKQILRELRFNMKCSSSPHIVTMYGMFYDSSLIYIAMEYMGGKSLDAIYNNLQMKGGRIGEKVLGKIAESVLRGLSYLHERKIIHRDIKPSNILMNLQGEVKLCDFGVSGEAVNSLATTFTGTSFYMAPERIQGQPYSVTSDVWSLGLTILEVAEGHFPLFSAIDGNNDGNNIDIDLPPIELLMMIINFKPELKDEPEYGLVWSKSFKNFVNYCLKKNPQDRPSPRQMLNHPWIQGQMKKKVNMAKFIKTCWQDD